MARVQAIKTACAEPGNKQRMAAFQHWLCSIDDDKGKEIIRLF